MAGRPSLYNPDRHPRLALSYARKGMTNEEIAKKFKITRETLYQWQKKYPELSDALSRGRDLAVVEIEESMFKLAKGYEVEETKIIGTPEKDEAGNERIRPIRIEKTKKHIPPREGAAKLLLNAWAPDSYVDKVQQEVAGSVDVRINIEQEVKRIAHLLPDVKI